VANLLEEHEQGVCPTCAISGLSLQSDRRILGLSRSLTRVQRCGIHACLNGAIPDMSNSLLSQIAEGRTDRVFEYLATGAAATSVDADGVPLIQLCAYHGDVSAITHVLANGEVLASLGANLDLNGAVFHGHVRLCAFLMENGADVNQALAPTGESPLHSALCTTDRTSRDQIIQLLLARGANPNCATNPSVETESFMRDCRTKGETPLHRAAAFGSEATIQLLLDAGADRAAKDMHGDSPLGWASWYARPRPIIRQLCYGRFRA
jgi:uncharacterized protein